MGDNSVEELTIPALVTSISDGALSGMRGLKTLTVESDNPEYKSENNILLTKDGKRIISVAGNISGTCIIPNGVEEIGKYAFSECTNLTGVNIPSGVTKILSRAFNHCTQIKQYEIPETVTTIEDNVFKDNRILETIVIRKEENSITGSPWGAGSETQITWSK